MNRIIFYCLFFISVGAFAQTQEIKLDPVKVQMFTPYMEWKHGGKAGFPVWKQNNMLQYAQEMWYYSESFYVKRNNSEEGVTLDESMIDITRYEQFRKENEEAIVPMLGFKDALVLRPTNGLIYKLPF